MRRALLLAVVVSSGPAWAGPAGVQPAPDKTWSSALRIRAYGGVTAITLDRNGQHFEEEDADWEVGGTFEARLSPRVGLEFGANLLRGDGDTRDEFFPELLHLSMYGFGPGLSITDPHTGLYALGALWVNARTIDGDRGSRVRTSLAPGIHAEIGWERRAWWHLAPGVALHGSAAAGAFAVGLDVTLAIE
jgi:hypothetical protein